MTQESTRELNAITSEVAVYPVPDGIPTSDRYTIRIRTLGGAWHELTCYRVEIDLHNPRPSSMAYFDFDGEVEGAVTYNGGEMRSTRVRPLSYCLEPASHANTLTMRLQHPRNLSIEVNGDCFDNLHLFAGPIDRHVPDPTDANVI
ncbi:MAG: hypothetical protein QM770_14345 [Tepidisphaeraceae bacterium]